MRLAAIGNVKYRSHLKIYSRACNLLLQSWKSTFCFIPSVVRVRRICKSFFLHNVTCKHNKHILVNVCRYVEYHGLHKLFEVYKGDVGKAKLKPLSKSYLYKIWRNVINEGVVEPNTGTKYCTHVRVNHCRGFTQCTTCEILSADLARAIDDDEREEFRRALAEHRAEVS